MSDPSPYVRAPSPCDNFVPAQEPELPTTVCLECGWERDEHREPADG
jgi:hypothetical protein